MPSERRFEKYPIAVRLLQKGTLPLLYVSYTKPLDAAVPLIRKKVCLGFLANIKPVLISLDFGFKIIKKNLPTDIQKSVF